MKEVRNTFLTHRSRVTATLPALGTMVSVPLSDTTLWMPICTPECTVPISTSTPSRLTRRSAFCGAFSGLDSSSSLTIWISRPPSLPPFSAISSSMAKVMFSPSLAKVPE